MWGWAICAVVFMLMGLLPMVFIIRSFVRALEEKRSEVDEHYPGKPGAVDLSWGSSLLIQLLAAAGGVVLGIVFFGAIS